MDFVVKDVFAGQPIGIFESSEQLDGKKDSLETWDKLEEHELRLRMSTSPRNYFEKMAYWTEEGKIWHFPIDNEQGNDGLLSHFFGQITNVYFLIIQASMKNCKHHSLNIFSLISIWNHGVLEKELCATLWNWFALDYRRIPT